MPAWPFFADEAHFYTFGIWRTAHGCALIATRREGVSDSAEGKPISRIELPKGQSRLWLRVRIHDADCGFDYALAQGKWSGLVAKTDGSMLASARSNQFTGVVIGLYAKRAGDTAAAAE